MNMNINQSENQGVTVTPPAKEKIAELLSGADQSQSAVRVFVSGGGCGGMNYGMTFAESVEETDRLIQDNSGCSIAIDPVALKRYLECRRHTSRLLCGDQACSPDGSSMDARTAETSEGSSTPVSVTTACT